MKRARCKGKTMQHFLVYVVMGGMSIKYCCTGGVIKKAQKHRVSAKVTNTKKMKKN